MTTRKHYAPEVSLAVQAFETLQRRQRSVERAEVALQRAVRRIPEGDGNLADYIALTSRLIEED